MFLMMIIIIVSVVIIIFGHHHHCNRYCFSVAEISVGSVGTVISYTFDDRRSIPDRDGNLFPLSKTQTSLRKPIFFLTLMDIGCKCQ
jgi:hypothetical protein